MTDTFNISQHFCSNRSCFQPHFRLRRWSDKYLALKKFNFLKNCDLFLDLYTYLNDTQTCKTRLKNTFSGGLLEWPFQIWKQKETVSNLVNTVYMGIVCRVIRPVWQCEPIVIVEKYCLLLQMGSFFCNSALNWPNNST